MTDYKEGAVPVGDLLLDPNNYRFQDESLYRRVAENRFHEATVQERAARRVRDDGIQALKDSILGNGFIPVERLVVREYQPDGKELKYLVLEGNRRLTALKWIKEDHEAGINVGAHVLEVLDKVPVIILGSGEVESTYLSLMGIRHVGGIKEWGGYQRAKLVTELRDDHGLDTPTVASKLGLSAHEVNRRYRAFKALQQMQQDEEYADRATAEMYPIFHEAVSISRVKTWLNWDEATSKFANLDDLHQFYDLLVDDDPEGAPKVPAKLTSYAQVRELRGILDNPEAKAALFDPKQTFSEAEAIARADDLTRTWRSKLSSAVRALEGIGALELKGLSDEEAAEIAKVAAKASEVLDLRLKLLS